jgi:GNAT superfamily N-acetyltransferase
MRYTGPWHDAIVRLDTARRVAVKKRILHETLCAEIGEGVTARADHPSQPGLSEPSQSYWIGVRAGNDICAVLASVSAYERRERSSNQSPIMQVALWVSPKWRRRGMAQALLQECITDSRQAGVRHLVFDGLDGDDALRQLLRRFSTDFVFAGGTCQAWLELGAVAAPVAAPVFAY